jgi:hypothetical protein
MDRGTMRRRMEMRSGKEEVGWGVKVKSM